MDWKLIALCLPCSMILSRLILPSVITLALKHSFLDIPSQHKRHARPVPLLGGVALFLSIWLTIGAASLLFPSLPDGLRDSLLYVFLGALIITMTGLSDDLKPLSAWGKLFAQVAAGVVLFMGGLQIDPVSVPFYGAIEIGSYSAIITVAWVVGLSNAINLIDGLDGLAGGVSLIGALTLSVVAWLLNVPEVMPFSMALIGFLAIFLYYNRYPARIFLGDSGSLQIGYYFAVISLLVPVKSFTAAALYVPLLVLAVPIIEAAVSLVRRLVSGRNIMVADRRHIFHYLSLAGFSRKTTVRIFCGQSVIFGFLAVAMFFWDRMLVLGLLALFMVVIFVIFFILRAKLSRFRRVGRSFRKDDPTRQE